MSTLKQTQIQFPFNKYEMWICLIIVITGSIHVLIQLYPYCQEHYVKTSESYFGMRNSHDFQWEAFRSNFILMVGVAIVWKLIGSKNNPSILGFVLIAIMFRADIFLYFGVIIISYIFSVSLYKNKRFQLMKWIFVVSSIGFIEYNNRFRSFSKSMASLIPLEWFKNTNHIVQWASILNMSLLKMLSFGVDIHRSFYNKQTLQKHYDKCKSCLEKAPCIKAREMFPSQPPTFINYINYILFPGTLLAGPPISYNGFHSFKTVPIDAKNPTLRFILVFVFFEIFQHYFFQSIPSQKMTLLQLSVQSIVSLLYIWFKFNIIWKWAKVWSYYQGIQVIDNMNRCVLNNYGFEGFWRMWHRGFNAWLVRYMYIPLGGNKSIIKAYVLVFLFVAFWHDPQLKLLVWAGVIILFIIPQVMVKKIFRQKYSHLFSKYWFKYLSAFAGALYINMMCIANIIGFGFGLEGVWIVLNKMRQQWITQCIIIGFLVTTVNVMFYVRFLEKDDYGY